MFILTNDQRKCFGLLPVKDSWECVEAIPNRFDNYKTYLYFDGDTIVKCVLSGESRYTEYEMSDKITADRKYLLPKTSKGKPTLLTATSIQKRNGMGMCLTYCDKRIDLYNTKTQCSYYMNTYLNDGIDNVNKFIDWVEKWCAETTQADFEDVLKFSKSERKHVKFKEGDVFRFKIDRRLYGYGRVILNMDKMRKEKVEFWDIIMCKPVVCSVYHILTDRDNVKVTELSGLKSLPSNVIMDNSLYYGEFTIIGNIPITDNEDYPVMYGRSIHWGEDAIYYQCGREYRRVENGKLLYGGFTNNGIGSKLNFNLEILEKCINENSNEPYWENYYPSYINGDLRNPKFSKELKEIKEFLNIK